MIIAKTFSQKELNAFGSRTKGKSPLSQGLGSTMIIANSFSQKEAAAEQFHKLKQKCQLLSGFNQV
jgi:hypothetical protein